MAGLCLLYGAIVGLGLLECEVSSHNEFFDSLHKSGMCEGENLPKTPLRFISHVSSSS